MTVEPTIGRVVHYVAFGTPVRGDGTQAFPSACRSATITEVGADGVVGLCVLNPTGLFFHPLIAGGCAYNEGEETPGSPDCPQPSVHGNPFRYCPCGWAEARPVGGTWHWPERVGS